MGLGRLAELVVDITGNRRPVDGVLAGVKTSLMKTAAMSANLGSGLLSGLGAPTAAVGVLAIGAALGKAVMGASDLAESMSKVEGVFGPNADAVKKQADEMASKFGLVKREVLDSNARLAGLGKGIGNLSGGNLTDFTGQFTKLAADMSSFQNISFEEAITALSSGLSGEIEPLKRFGVVLSDDAVKAKAMAMGLASSKKELDDSAKFAARTALIMEKTADAQGDLEKTAGGFANQSRKLWGTLMNSLTAFGTAISPLSMKFVSFLNGAAGGIGEFVERNGPAFTAFAEGVGRVFDEVRGAVGGFFEMLSTAAGDQDGLLSWMGGAWEGFKGVVAGAIEYISAIFRNWTLIGEEVGIRFMGMLQNIGVAFGYARDVAAAFGNYVGTNWRDLIRDGVNAAWAVFQNFGTNVDNLFSAVWDAVQGKGFNFNFTPLLEGFKATAAALPEIAKPAWVSIEGQLDELHERMVAREIARTDKLKADAQAAPKAGAAAAKAGAKAEAKTDKETKAGFSGLEEFNKKLQEAVSGGSAVEKTAEGVGKLVGLGERANQLQEQAIKKPAGPAVFA